MLFKDKLYWEFYGKLKFLNKVTAKKLLLYILRYFELVQIYLSIIQVRSEIIATYALYGFANLSSTRIQLKILSSMTPAGKTYPRS